MKILRTTSFFSFDNHYANFLWDAHNDSLHRHDFFEIFYLVSGSLQHTINGTSEQLSAGSLYILRPTDAHSCNKVHKNTQTIQRNFLISIDEFKRTCDLFSPSLYSQILSSPTIKLSLSLSQIERLEASFKQLRPDGDNLEYNIVLYRFILSKFLERFFCKNPPPTTTISPFIQEIIYTINSNRGLRFTPHFFLTQYPYTPSYISKQFKLATNYTLTDYINLKRLEYADLLLQTTNLNLAQISEEVGYNNYPYFHKRFLKHFKKTPQERRKELKNMNRLDQLK